jgi:aspartate/methionine/tyrosine aminotransferase
MKLPPFLLDHWIAKYEFADPSIAYNLAASTGPKLSLHELLKIGGGRLDDVTLSYAPPEGQKALRAAIAEFHGVDPDWVVTTTGGSEALAILYCLAVEPGAEIVLPDLGFPAFDAVASAWGLKATYYALRRDENFAQTADAVLAAARRNCVLALVNSPNNPTGAVMPRREIEKLASGLAERGARLIVDEVYRPLYFGKPEPSAAGIDNVIVVSDMSKALSLPGLRTGWLIIGDRELRKRAIDARSYFTISGSPLLEALTLHALNNRESIFAALREAAERNLALLTDFMACSSDTLDWVPPAGGTVCFPWFKDGRDARPFCEAAAARGVLIAPGDCFGALSHMRFGFGAQAQGYDHALAVLSELLSGK